METYAHAFFTWALAKHGVKAGRAAGIAGAVGAALPDLPAIAGTLYYWQKDGNLWTEASLDAIYFSGFFGGTGSALHSAVPAGALLGAYLLLRLGRVDRRRILLWFLLGWAGHAVADFLTHATDPRPLFWPVSAWEWSSPVSYYDPRYYGLQFTIVEHVSIVAIMIMLMLRRLHRRKFSAPSSKST